jgi:hypothetical protein
MSTPQSFFDRACAALRDGNPYPMLSDQVAFDSETAKAQWRKRADLMLDIRESIHSRIVSIALADDIQRLLIDDPELANPTLAKTLLSRLLENAEENGEGDKAYANFLAEIAPNEDISKVVSAERTRRQKVAAHVRTLLANIDA